MATRIKKGAQHSVRPILVRFSRRVTRDTIYAARRRLFESRAGIFINEHLSKMNSSLFFDARKMVKEHRIHSAWTRGGAVFVKKTSVAIPTKISKAADFPN
jgi:hypothetical protein